MKKVLALLVTLMLLLPAMAMGDENRISANGTVESVYVYQLTAPYSGVIKPFDWESGDRVSKGENLFEMDTIKVYAPADGTVEGLFAQKGDLAENVLAQYGSLAVLERTLPQIINASTNGAYNDPENRLIHVGEKVYFEQANDKDNQGEGRVISVTGDNYVVEITEGDFELKDQVKLFRDEKHGTKSAIGRGDVARAADMVVSGSGRVLNVAVHQGEKVRKGQLLFELAAQDALTEADSCLASPADGAIEVCVASGQQVYMGQVIGKVHGLSAFQVTAQVDEVDLGMVQVGDTLSVTLDRYPDMELTGVVTQIAALGQTRQNAAYFDVTLSLSTTMELLPGMSATVWLNGQD